jgi:transcriptional regulator with XRE-family HTH domain
MRKAVYPSSVTLRQLHAWWLEARELRGLTQVALARRLGVQQPQVARLFAGSVSVRARSFRKLCALANVSLDTHDAQELPMRLLQLLYDAWGGSTAREEPLAQLLEGACALRELPLADKSPARNGPQVPQRRSK